MDMGIIATTAPGGAGKWLDIHTNALAGATVDIIADNDKPGYEHAAIVFKALSSAGCDVQSWVCPETKDITDHLNAGGSLDSLVFFDAESYDEPTEQVKETTSLLDDGEENPAEEALGKISSLLLRDDLTTQQKLIKVSNALHTYTTPTDLVIDKGRLVNWEEFLRESTHDEYEWVIPWLLEKNERVIVVAAEGVGKTMLARQVAILSATGMHPFTYQRIRPVKTLTVDLENPERIIRRTSRSIQENALKYGFERKSIAELFSKPSGLDLLKTGDRILLEEQIEKAKPEVLIMGPLYKAFVDPGGRTSEAVAVEVAKYLDYIRVTYNCALWLEHHAPLGQSQSTRELRPFGSAVWSRWPEFGLALQPDFGAMTPYTYDVRHFRGARDERPWPTKIKRGKRFPFEVIEFSGVSE
jgi:replicative DNA helicase